VRITISKLLEMNELSQDVSYWNYTLGYVAHSSSHFEFLCLAKWDYLLIVHLLWSIGCI